ncbi:ubiquitin carboxyl-terminal hydrolase 14 [Chironomus tepperi]|uniref:ubiquitin carboxyl-terminal hydrolase 14 n=1 Tax=Chironomus tepperi TaxID=113505 RepID=UPI00391F07EA
MPNYTVKVKWNKETFTNVVVNTDESVLEFKAQLFTLSCVPVERQKIMCAGKTLKDDEWNIPLKNGAVILLLGTSEEISVAPVEKTKFIEDMTESELAQAIELPPGLVNLGNTCYLNAVVQCLRSVPELRECLKEFKQEAGFAAPQSITLAMKGVFEQMERSATVTPIMLLQTLHAVFPQFAQTGEKGTYRQQDANECWVELLKMLQQKLPTRNSESSTTSYPSFIEQFFGGTFDCSMKCTESEDEEPSKSKENFLQLSCFINQEVKYMHSGLRLRLNEQITKRSSLLERDAIYTKQSLISRLPAYLTINFVRFQYKGKEGINAKVLKDIKFPLEFDAFDLCSPELQQKLIPMRTKFKEIEDAAVLEKDQIKMKGEKVEEKKTRALQYYFDEDLGSNNSGFYTLQAVLTHQGRSSSSGHYVGWVRHKGDQWHKFDDDTVTPVASDEILRLSGGGDWHVAYLLLYGPKICNEPIEEGKEETTPMSVD